MNHLDQTRTHVGRLEEIFKLINQEPKRDACPAMQGLVKEGSDIISASGDDATIDAGLIAAAQKVEHYEIATYGTVRNFAQRLGLSSAASMLQQTLDEEGATDKLLTQIAERSANPQAAH